MATRSRLVLASCLAGVWLASSSYAQLFTPTSQTRSLVVEADLGSGGPAESDTFLAPDFGPMSASITADVVDAVAGDRATALASQVSTITSSGITSSSSFSAALEGSGQSASCTSLCVVTFTVHQACRYHLSGSVSAFESAGSSCTLWGFDAGTVFGTQAPGPNGTNENNEFEVAGILLPGSYRFTQLGGADGMANSPDSGGSGSSSAELHLSPATSADCIATRNSTGSVAILSFFGDLRVGSNYTFASVDRGPPESWGLLFYGTPMSPVAFGNGVLCVSNPLFRVGAPLQFDLQGSAVQPLDYSKAPLSSGAGQVIPGSTWTFQYWYRDAPAPGGDGWNTSSAVSATFAP